MQVAQFAPSLFRISYYFNGKLDLNALYRTLKIGCEAEIGTVKELYQIQIDWTKV
jgi:hypothetical protein